MNEVLNDMPLWFYKLARPAQRAYGLFYFKDDFHYALIERSEARLSWYGHLFLFLVSPIVLAYLAITAIAYLIVSKHRKTVNTQELESCSMLESPSESASTIAVDHKLTISDFEWWVANQAANYLKKHGFSKEDQVLPKLSRKAADLWKRKAREFVSRLPSEEVPGGDKEALCEFLLRGRLRTKDTVDEFHAGDSLSVHSFEFLLEEGKIVPYATSVHSYFAKGGFSKIKYAENVEGDLKIKKVTNLAKIPEMSIRKNFLVMHHLHQADALAFRREAAQTLLPRNKAITLGKLMSCDLDQYIPQSTDPHQVKQQLQDNPIQLFLMFESVIEQLSDLHDPSTSPTGNTRSLPVARYLHLDVKPKNVLVEKKPDGGVELLLVDFDGLVKVPAGAEEFKGRLSLPRPFITTPRYRPPEMLRASPLDVRVGMYSDIYALGLSMEVLKARCAFNPSHSPRQQALLNQLVDMMTNRQNYRARPSADELLEYINSIKQILALPISEADREIRFNALYQELAQDAAAPRHSLGRARAA